MLLVDGNNLLHAVAGNAGPASLRGLLPRLVAAVPPDVDTVVVLDGSPDPGAPSRMRVRRGLAIRHAGRVSADALIVQLVETRPFPDRAGVLVVTNDLALTEAGPAQRRAGPARRLARGPPERGGGRPGTRSVDRRPASRGRVSLDAWVRRA